MLAFTSSLKELHNEVEVFLVLEGAGEVDDPRVAEGGEDISFRPDVVDLISA